MARRKKGRVWIGTSNIVVPGAKHTFPEEYRDKSRLTYYASLFNSLEVNSTFYKLPMAKTFEKWAGEVPDHFQFSVKLLRNITHAKGLLYPAELIERFMYAANHLHEKKGCLLIQFPGSITVHYAEKIEEILDEIARHNTRNAPWRMAIELRHHSWYRESSYQLLRKHKTSLVIHDKPKSATPDIQPQEDSIYMRFHGPEGDYRSSYHEEHIEAKAAEIRELLEEGRDVYAYFNNTIGDAFTNAQLLQELLKRH